MHPLQQLGVLYMMHFDKVVATITVTGQPINNILTIVHIQKGHIDMYIVAPRSHQASWPILLLTGQVQINPLTQILTSVNCNLSKRFSGSIRSSSRP